MQVTSIGSTEESEVDSQVYIGRLESGYRLSV